MTTAIALPNTVAFNDAAVFGRVSDKVIAYLDRVIDDAPVAPKAPGFFETLVERVQTYFANRATLAILERQSDRMLADIGMTRASLHNTFAA